MPGAVVDVPPSPGVLGYLVQIIGYEKIENVQYVPYFLLIMVFAASIKLTFSLCGLIAMRQYSDPRP